MNEIELEQIQKEIETTFVGRRFGKVFPLSKTSFAVDLHPHNGAYLFVDIDSKVRKIYLIRRRLKDLERQSVHSSPFVIQIRKLFAGRELLSVDKDQSAMVLRLRFSPQTTDTNLLAMIAQIGGRSPNVFVTDEGDNILFAAREINETGQSVGRQYIAPIETAARPQVVRDLKNKTLSEIFDEESKNVDAESVFNDFSKQAGKKLTGEIIKRRKLIKNLEGDLLGHGDAEEWKRFGDLILANISSLRFENDKMIVTDYFDADLADVYIPVEKNQTPTQTAEAYFKKYAKARNAAAAIEKRMDEVQSELSDLMIRQKRLNAAIESRDLDRVLEFLPKEKPKPVSIKRKENKVEFKGARKFVSSDGYEILVGKKAKDNDQLTFRVAKSLDLWLHAADYPGSHVVVRIPNRKDVPVRTLIEAAQLAAFYSDAREKPKAAVNYTPRKFVNKPKRSAPGLVSLASFKTILVEPKIGDASVEKS